MVKSGKTSMVDELSNKWKFWINEGGTFTDCVAFDPDENIHTCKIFNSGIVRCKVHSFFRDSNKIYVEGIEKYPKNFFRGNYANFYRNGEILNAGFVKIDSSENGIIYPEIIFSLLQPGDLIEIFSTEPIPILIIRKIMSIRSNNKTDNIEIRLGTNRGFALFTENIGALTAFLTTKGFADILEIGNQTRSDIFNLKIQKKSPLYRFAAEINERTDKDGNILEPLDENHVKSVIKTLKRHKYESLAVCLMNSYKNSEHEKRIKEIAKESGFEQVFISSEVSPEIGLVSRGNTTVLDAVLTPVIHQYFNEISKKINNSDFKVMKSSGDLSDFNEIKAKDILSSNKVGGITGLKHVSECSGLKKIIGFDMGGSSTNISLFDGKYDYKHKIEKEGMEIISYELDSENIPVGGRSVCEFDGQSFSAGPRNIEYDTIKESGLSVSDINVFLGRIIPEYFTFHADLNKIEKKLENIKLKICKKRNITTQETAESFIKTINVNIALFIKKIFTEKGLDIKEYALSSFGGASSQHVCSVARELGIKDIVIHPYSGIFGAYGIGSDQIGTIKYETKYSEQTVYPDCLKKSFVKYNNSVVSAEIFLRSNLNPGHKIKGPAIIVDDFTSIFIEPEWECLVNKHKMLILKDISEFRIEDRVSKVKHDPLMFGILNSYLKFVTEQMEIVLRKNIVSTDMKEKLDFSCAVFDNEGNMITNNLSSPIHLGISECIKNMIADVVMNPGDVIVTNNPFKGGCSLNYITVVTPIFDKTNKEIMFFIANRIRHTEIGGSISDNPICNFYNLSDEGILIDNFKVIESGNSNILELRKILTSSGCPSKYPDENISDISAQIASNKYGVKDISDLCDRYGEDTILTHMKNILEISELNFIGKISGFVNGHNFSGADQLDNSSKIFVSIFRSSKEIIFDFKGTSCSSHNHNFNTTPAVVRAIVFYCLKSVFNDNVPVNDGMMRVVKINLPNCMINPEISGNYHTWPAVSAGVLETSQVITDIILRSLCHFSASQGTSNSLSFWDDNFRYQECICGGTGAGSDFSGFDAVQVHMTNTRIVDSEIIESKYPVLVRKFEIREYSGGISNCSPGGNGVRREIEFLKPLRFSIISDRRRTRPLGIGVGLKGCGKSGKNIFISRGEIIHLNSCAISNAEFGDRILIETPGGGSYGI
jgi:5-oxoprolinase (ATP-hydrolysing)